MKISVIAISSSYVMIITIVYALLVHIFFELDNALAEQANFIIDDNDKMMKYNTQQVVETQCKSPCPPPAVMCIQMCA